MPHYNGCMNLQDWVAAQWWFNHNTPTRHLVGAENAAISQTIAAFVFPVLHGVYLRCAGPAAEILTGDIRAARCYCVRVIFGSGSHCCTGAKRSFGDLQKLPQSWSCNNQKVIIVPAWDVCNRDLCHSLISHVCTYVGFLHSKTDLLCPEISRLLQEQNGSSDLTS